MTTTARDKTKKMPTVNTAPVAQRRMLTGYISLLVLSKGGGERSGLRRLIAASLRSAPVELHEQKPDQAPANQSPPFCTMPAMC